MNEPYVVPERLYFFSENVAKSDKELKETVKGEVYDKLMADTAAKIVKDPKKANLISSLCASGMHAPVIDFDVPIEVYPSSQLGHHHLYINKEITWVQFKGILRAFEYSGLVEPGYVKASMAKNQSFVRPVGVVKIDAPRGAQVLMENARLRQENHELRQKIAAHEAELNQPNANTTWQI